MGVTTYVQSNSAVGSGLNVTSFSISLPAPVSSGNWVFLNFRLSMSAVAGASLNVTSTVAFQFPSIDFGPNPSGTNKFIGVWAGFLKASGAITLTATITSTARIADFAAAIAEYTSDPVTTAQGFASFQGWSGPNLGGAPLTDNSVVGGINPLTDTVINVGWQPLTAYSNAGTSQVKDTTATPELQGVFIAGTSGATAPAWVFGGNTHDGTVTWTDIGTAATPGLMNLLGIGVSSGFVEFPAFAQAAQYIKRVEINDAVNGFQLWEKQTNFVDTETITLTKSANTYHLDMSLTPMSASAPVPAASGPIRLPQNVPVLYLPSCGSTKCRTISMVFERD